MLYDLAYNASILIGNADKASSHLYHLILKSAGVSIRQFQSVGSFDAAKTLLEETASSLRPSLVFLDMEFLPDGPRSCFALVKEIRQHYNGSVLIAVCGPNDDSNVEKTRMVGANAYIAKGKTNEFRKRIEKFKKHFIDDHQSDFCSCVAV